MKVSSSQAKKRARERFKIAESSWTKGNWTILDTRTQVEYTCSSTREGMKKTLQEVIEAYKTKTSWFDKNYQRRMKYKSVKKK